MSRSISKIYSEAIAKRNAYLQLTELNSGRSGSKMSVLNIMTYVMSAMIYAYETMLDVFEVNIARLIEKRINGTAQYYAVMAKYFQYNEDTEHGDELIFDEDSLSIQYKVVDKTHRIISRSAYQFYGNNNGITIKVCKNNPDASNTEGGGLYVPLSETELKEFKAYMNDIKFIGAQIDCLSIPGDIMHIKAKIVYNNLYVTEEQAFENVKTALINYIQNLDYNGYIYYQSVIDAIQSADYIEDVKGVSDDDKYAHVYLIEYNRGRKNYDYDSPKELVGRATAYSGYLTFVDSVNKDSDSMLQIGTEYLTFEPQS